MPMVIELCDEDLGGRLLRVHRQRQSANSTYGANPNLESLLRGLRSLKRIRATSQQGGFYWTCVCNKPLSVSAPLREPAPECGAEFDFTGFGK